MDLSILFSGNVAEGRLFPVEFLMENVLKVVELFEGETSGRLYDWARKVLPF